MSTSRRNAYAKRSLVPVLGFFALSLFVINFFTFLSHRLGPDGCDRVCPGFHLDRHDDVAFEDMDADAMAFAADMARIRSEIDVAREAMRCARERVRVEVAPLPQTPPAAPTPTPARIPVLTLLP